MLLLFGDWLIIWWLAKLMQHKAHHWIAEVNPTPEDYNSSKSYVNVHVTVTILKLLVVLLRLDMYSSIQKAL